MEAKNDTTWVVKIEAKCGSKMEVKLNIKFEAILGAISGSK
jgi:hypothetical protein